MKIIILIFRAWRMLENLFERPGMSKSRRKLNEEQDATFLKDNVRSWNRDNSQRKIIFLYERRSKIANGAKDMSSRE